MPAPAGSAGQLQLLLVDGFPYERSFFVIGIPY
jgi:hypothetical protein